MIIETETSNLAQKSMNKVAFGHIAAYLYIIKLRNLI